jgi:hypothetical protein
METVNLSEEELSKVYDSKSLFELACKNNAIVIANDKKRDRYKIVATYALVDLWWGNLLATYKDKTGNCKKNDDASVLCKGTYHYPIHEENDKFGPKNIIIAECISI